MFGVKKKVSSETKKIEERFEINFEDKLEKDIAWNQKNSGQDVNLQGELVETMPESGKAPIRCKHHLEEKTLIRTNH